MTSTTVYTQEECSKHRSEKDCWLVIHGKVYDVTKFLDEHPGGYDIVVAASGRDGTEDFEEIGHSSAAKEMLAEYHIGEYEGGDAHVQAPVTSAAPKHSSGSGGLMKALLPLLVILIAIVLYQLRST